LFPADRQFGVATLSMRWNLIMDYAQLRAAVGLEKFDAEAKRMTLWWLALRAAG
jgi:hypothetical protein